MTREERETEQKQQMFNFNEEQTALKTLATNTYDNFNHVSSLVVVYQIQLAGIYDILL